MKQKKLNLSLDGVKAKVVYHNYDGYDLNTLVVGFKEKRCVLSTLDGYKKVSYVANNYTPTKLSMCTMQNYKAFKRRLPLSLGIKPKDVALLSTGVNMDNLAVCEKSYEEFQVCCLATAGAKGNALRTGVDVANYVERNGKFVGPLGTINIFVLTNARLKSGAMARAVITVTEAKTAALEDLHVPSTYTPSAQATGTGTDNVVVVSGTLGKPLLITSGHTKIGELIGAATKTAVTQALKNNDGIKE
ncbi:MAG: adenosylcobinamide amidohydrolase [Candidatus Bathyarchaeota archaeon]|nr:adenosylcobinamide amidohydrolase [Candidatus Bathyarchaeota archaeon]